MSLVRVGSDLIEIGLPFSDPVADGPIIQRSSFSALEHGYKVADYIELVRRIRAESDVGLIFMTYLNPILQYGLGKLDRDASDAGLDGILISDLTPEEYLLMGQNQPVSGPESEGAGFGNETFEHLDTVFLAAPTSSPARLDKICQVSTGFVYLVARTGVTGDQSKIDETLANTIEMIRTRTELPIAVGFGIRSSADVKQVWKYADGAVVGSAIVRFIDENRDAADLAMRLEKFVRETLLPS
jgi:tryptophan synthase alpha chain